MSKDPVQALVDEITLIRGEVKNLQRTSLSKDEAKALNSHVAQALAQMKAVAGEMSAAASEAPHAVRTAVRHDLVQIDRNTSQAASRAAQQAVEGLRAHLDAERLRFAEAAGEARRAAWRSFGGLWVWLVAMLATGAFLGLLAAYVTEAGQALVEVSDMVPYACEWSIVGGQLVEQEDGSSYCLFWIERPEQIERSRAREGG